MLCLCTVSVSVLRVEGYCIHLEYLLVIPLHSGVVAHDRPVGVCAQGADSLVCHPPYVQLYRLGRGGEGEGGNRAGRVFGISFGVIPKWGYLPK